MAKVINKRLKAKIRQELFCGKSLRNVASETGALLSHVRIELQLLVNINAGQARSYTDIGSDDQIFSPAPMLAITQAEFICMISRHTISGYIRQGRIKSKLMGGRHMIDPVSLIEFLQKPRPRGVAGQKALHGDNWQSSYKGSRPHRVGLKHKKKKK